MAEDVQEVAVISTNVWMHCPACQEGVASANEENLGFTERVNHLLSEHGWKLLHVGQDTETGMDGNPHHNTVAVLGKPS